MSTSRRRFLVAGSSAIAVAASSRVRAQSPDASRKAKIDSLLQRAVEAGDVPGVIAMATDRNGVIYEGAYGKRVLGQPAAMTADTVVWIADLAKYQAAKNIPGIISCENAALRTPLLFDPGDRWFYGINIDWAGKMVEAVSGKRLGLYLQENVFAPLGMASTAFKIRPDMRDRLAKIHQRGDNDAFTPQMDLEIPQDPEFEMGGGGLYGTGGDYLRFVRMILNHGKADGNQVLKPETIDLMIRNNMGDNRVTLLKTAMPPLSNDAEFFPGMPKT